MDESVFSFGAFELLPARQQLLESGRPLRIGSRAFGLLQTLSETLGNGTFSYEGAQSAENPELSVWRFSVFGGLTVSGDPEAPSEISSVIGAITASHALLARLTAMETPELFAGTADLSSRSTREETRNVLGSNSFQQPTARLWRSRANPFRS